jgi:hypothetical protein
MAQVDRGASVSATISLRGISAANEWTSDRELAVKKQAGASDSVTLNIAAGGIAVIELRSGN